MVSMLFPTNAWGVRIVDISVPTNPTLVHQTGSGSGGKPIGVFVVLTNDDSTLYYMSLEKGVQVFDVTDPGSPVLLSEYKDLDRQYYGALSPAEDHLFFQGLGSLDIRCD